MNRMKTGVRISYLSLALVALLTSIVMQVISAFLMVFTIGVISTVQCVLEGVTDMAEIELRYMTAVNQNLSVTIVVTHLMLLAVFGIWYKKGCVKQDLKSVPFRTIFTAKNVLVMVLISAGMCFLTNFAMPVASEIIPEGVMAEYEELMETAGFGESILPTIAAVLIAPFGEELIFRGVTFFYAKKAVSDMADRRKAFWIANCIQALGFGVFHMNLVQGTYAFFTGLALGYLAHRFGSVLPAMLGHMIVNGLSTLAWEPVAKLLPQSQAVFGICSLLCLGIVCLGLYLGGPAEKLKKL